MKNWLKENWFKGGLLLLGFLFLVIFAYNQYLETRKHNLDVVNSMRLCANLEGEAVKSCAKAVERQKI